MNRYPGIRPFRSDEKHLFFGREADTESLYRLLRLEQLVILYAKSGYGKSSLLQAGIYPRLLEEGRYRFWEVRFGPYKPGESRLPADAVAEALGGGASIWEALKSRQTLDNRRFILFFDQFEELFSYPAEQIGAFKQQMAEALYADVPERLNQSAGDEAVWFEPFELKTLFSIRADRMSLLNGLKDYLPNLLKHGYELDALDENQATKAVTIPAGLPVALDSGDSFDTPPFGYAPEALLAVFAALRDDSGRIETSTLQIICKHVEDNVIHGGRWTVDGGRPMERTPMITIETSDLGDIKSIFRQFYERSIANLPDTQQDTARRLVEDLLIKDGVRIPYAAQALLAVPGVTQDLLDRLAAASLLRVERDEQGRMLYEVGHDTLVAPVTEAAQARRAEEEKIRLQQEADEQRREKEKAVAARRRARLVAVGAIVLSLFAIGASYYAYVQTKKAGEQAKIIIQTQQEVEESKKLVDKKSIETASALKRAEDKELEARLKNEEVQRQKDATEEQKRLAAIALQQAQEERRVAEKATIKVVQSLLTDASSAIRRLDYETARDRLHDAADLTVKKAFDNPLGRLRTAVADSLLEPAYFYTETGNFAAAMFEIDKIAQALAVPDPADALLEKVTKASSVDQKRQVLADFRAALRQLRPDAFKALEEKYYPVMLPVPGGTFNLAENYRVSLSDYQLARTETTVWQYNLYLAAAGKDIFDEKTIPRPGWGWEGDNPIVYVSWYDAVQYANWSSLQDGLRPAYAIDTTGGDFKADTVSGSNGYRLPTEAEWEFAARGGASGIRDSFTYSGGNKLDLVGWYSENSGNRARAVAQLQPNQLGLFDMSGNVWEWCWDWYGDGYHSDAGDPVLNPSGPKEGSSRCLRGGAWCDVDGYCDPGYRLYWDPDNRSSSIGFRLARH